MMRRVLFGPVLAPVLAITAACFAAACTVEVHRDGERVASVDGEHVSGGYRLEVRADEDAQIFLVTAPDGKTAAGMVEGEASYLLGDAQIEALGDIPPPAAPEGEEEVSIRAPGFSLRVSGDDEDEEGGGVSMRFGDFSLDASGSDGKGAHVLISGVDAEAARDFIQDADDLSDEVKAQMIAALDLEGD